MGVKLEIMRLSPNVPSEAESAGCGLIAWQSTRFPLRLWSAHWSVLPGVPWCSLVTGQLTVTPRVSDLLLSLHPELERGRRSSHLANQMLLCNLSSNPWVNCSHQNLQAICPVRLNPVISLQYYRPAVSWLNRTKRGTATFSKKFCVLSVSIGVFEHCDFISAISLNRFHGSF